MRSTTQVGRRPLVRQISSTTTTSAGSGRFSRSSNNSNIINSSHSRFNNYKLNKSSDNRTIDMSDSAHYPPHRSLRANGSIRSIEDLSPTRRQHPVMDGPYRGLSRDRREMLNCSLSIPTTINEESTSRVFGSSPSSERLHTFKLINEAEADSSSSLNPSEVNEHLKSVKKKNKKRRKSSDENSSESISSGSRLRSASSSDSTSIMCSCQACRCMAMHAKTAHATSSEPSYELSNEDITIEGLAPSETKVYPDPVNNPEERKPLVKLNVPRERPVIIL